MKLKLDQVQTFEKKYESNGEQTKNKEETLEINKKTWIQGKSINTTDDKWKARIGRYPNAACDP